jgi:hypothetical protein
MHRFFRHEDESNDTVIRIEGATRIFLSGHTVAAISFQKNTYRISLEP